MRRLSLFSFIIILHVVNSICIRLFKSSLGMHSPSPPCDKSILSPCSLFLPSVACFMAHMRRCTRSFDIHGLMSVCLLYNFTVRLHIYIAARLTINLGSAFALKSSILLELLYRTQRNFRTTRPKNPDGLRRARFPFRRVFRFRYTTDPEKMQTKISITTWAIVVKIYVFYLNEDSFRFSVMINTALLNIYDIET